MVLSVKWAALKYNVQNHALRENTKNLFNYMLETLKRCKHLHPKQMANLRAFNRAVTLLKKFKSGAIQKQLSIKAVIVAAPSLQNLYTNSLYRFEAV